MRCFYVKNLPTYVFYDLKIRILFAVIFFSYSNVENVEAVVKNIFHFLRFKMFLARCSEASHADITHTLSAPKYRSAVKPQLLPRKTCYQFVLRCTRFAGSGHVFENEIFVIIIMSEILNS